MIDRFEDPTVTAADLAEEMRVVWELGQTVMTPVLTRSANIYYAAAADYSQNVQVVVFAAQLALLLIITLVPFRRYAQLCVDFFY